MTSPSASRRRAIAQAIERWFAAPGVARPFPWRTPSRDPYTSLVAEVMLQQTQASRVAERLPPFLARFPNIQSLARADEDAVLAQWSGLGYYRTAQHPQPPPPPLPTHLPSPHPTHTH
ncbi:MAG: hypothetical protein IBJ10_10560, partial [Phycisphaerales bacterium]|nr:hypothetical protein [Phycisphaerales bacterium]